MYLNAIDIQKNIVWLINERGLYTKQAFPFNGFMFVRQDKIPKQLKFCSVRVLRRRMVRYLSDATNFTRFDEADDSVLTSLSDFIFTFD